jgi:hypothetical protein
MKAKQVGAVPNFSPSKRSPSGNKTCGRYSACDLLHASAELWHGLCARLRGSTFKDCHKDARKGIHLIQQASHFCVGKTSAVGVEEPPTRDERQSRRAGHPISRLAQKCPAKRSGSW